jgi:hypothetical protein
MNILRAEILKNKFGIRNLLITLQHKRGADGSAVEALCYTPEDRGIY